MCCDLNILAKMLFYTRYDGYRTVTYIALKNSNDDLCLPPFILTPNDGLCVATLSYSRA